MKSLPLFLLLAAALAAQAEPSARGIVEGQISRHRLPQETTVMNIVLADRRGYREERVLRRQEKMRDGGLASSLTVFEAPADVKGTALLARENRGAPNDQWLYFPSQRRLQRVAQARRNGYFMGTDLTYEDMDPEKTDDFTYRFLDPETIGGDECHVIEATPAHEAQRRASGYGRRILWIRKDILFTVRVDYYDHRGTLVKTQAITELQPLRGEAWRAGRTVVENLAKQHRTEVTVVDRDTQADVPDSIFTERHILTGRYMQ